MESHEIREENRVLRARITEAQDKMRLLADALEKRNEQAKIWSQRCSDLEQQLQLAQDAINSHVQMVYDRDNAINQLRGMLEASRKEQMQIRNLQTDEAKRLQENIENQHKRFLETLNQLNQTRQPAKQTFEMQNDLIMKRDDEIKLLKGKVNDLMTVKESLEHELETSEENAQKLAQERDSFRRLNEDLMIALQDAKSGREELMEIEKLKVLNDKEHQKVLYMHRKLKHMGQVSNKLQSVINEKDGIIQEMTLQIEGYQDKANEYESRIQHLNNKLDEQRKLVSKCKLSEKFAVDKLKSEEQIVDNLKKQITYLEEEKEKLTADNNNKAAYRLKKITQSREDKNKIRELQNRVRMEMEKRLDVEESLFKFKEENAELLKQIALLKDEVVDARGADVEPLVELLKDLRVETIAVDGELLRLIDSIPESPSFEILEVPPGVCESVAAVVSRAAAKASELQIENKELRIILDKCVRIASTYHKVSSVISNYPILTADDIGTQEERGNWVLPVDTEHLQRTIVKLHEILIRKNPKNKL